MIKPLIVIIAALIVAGCQTKTAPPLIVRQPQVVAIPNKFFECRSVKKPDPTNLTDTQVASLILELEKANAECRRNSGAARDYQNRALKEIN